MRVEAAPAPPVKGRTNRLYGTILVAALGAFEALFEAALGMILAAARGLGETTGFLLREAAGCLSNSLANKCPKGCPPISLQAIYCLTLALVYFFLIAEEDSGHSAGTIAL